MLPPKDEPAGGLKHRWVREFQPRRGSRMATLLANKGTRQRLISQRELHHVCGSRWDEAKGRRLP
jgi:hypothetical protein